MILDVCGKEECVAPALDDLLAEIGRPPVDCEREFVRLHDARRLGKSFTHLREKGDVAVCVGTVVDERRVGELHGAAVGSRLHE